MRRNFPLWTENRHRRLALARKWSIYTRLSALSQVKGRERLEQDRINELYRENTRCHLPTYHFKTRRDLKRMKTLCSLMSDTDMNQDRLPNRSSRSVPGPVLQVKDHGEEDITPSMKIAVRLPRKLSLRVIFSWVATKNHPSLYSCKHRKTT